MAGGEEEPPLRCITQKWGPNKGALLITKDILYGRSVWCQKKEYATRLALRIQGHDHMLVSQINIHIQLPAVQDPVPRPPQKNRLPVGQICQNVFY